MSCLITKRFPSLPPYPHRIRVPPFDPLDWDDDDDPDPMKQARNLNGDASGPVPGVDRDDQLDRNDPERTADWIRVWSYGGYLLDDNNPDCRRVSRQLRRLVAQCLCDDPHFRPRLGMLNTLVRGHIDAAGWDDEDTDDGSISSDRGSYDPHDGGGGAAGGNQTDELMRVWVQKVFGNPPAHRGGR